MSQLYLKNRGRTGFFPQNLIPENQLEVSEEYKSQTRKTESLCKPDKLHSRSHAYTAYTRLTIVDIKEVYLAKYI